MKFVQVLRSLSLGPQPRVVAVVPVGARRRPGHRLRADWWQEACASPCRSSTPRRKWCDIDLRWVLIILWVFLQITKIEFQSRVNVPRWYFWITPLGYSLWSLGPVYTNPSVAQLSVSECPVTAWQTRAFQTTTATFPWSPTTVNSSVIQSTVLVGSRLAAGA